MEMAQVAFQSPRMHDGALPSRPGSGYRPQSRPISSSQVERPPPIDGIALSPKSVNATPKSSEPNTPKVLPASRVEEIKLPPVPGASPRADVRPDSSSIRATTPRSVSSPRPDSQSAVIRSSRRPSHVSSINDGDFEASHLQLSASQARQLARRLEEEFRLHDPSSNGYINMQDLGLVLRAMDYNPSEADLQEIMFETRGLMDDNIYLDKLEPKLHSMLADGRMLRDTEPRIRAAFEALDTDGKGWIEPDRLAAALQTQGEPFTTDELETLLEAAVDPLKGVVFYAAFAALLGARDSPSDAAFFRPVVQ
eukprot:TRINITY_DN31609_c0_g1_i1.p1 TRINITY_DN31609_c0_g1~~TRINITY_DN31609_c0_g1_i1.p1  ORF type:complete len:309 (-),score=56.46 TRINITY_DN31609_c0_g1_i1:280-1206(-)